MRKKRYAGSYTVEATFVMTIVIFVIFALIYLTFYLADKSKLQNMLDLTTVKVNEMLKENGNMESGEVSYSNISNKSWIRNLLGDYSAQEQVGENYLKSKLEHGLILAKINSVSMKITHTKIEAKIEVMMDIPLLHARQYFTKESLTAKLSSKASIHNPAEFIRLSDCVLSSTKKIKGADKVIETLKGLIEKIFGSNS